MERQKLIELAYNRGKFLNLKNSEYLREVDAFTDINFTQDTGDGDITSDSLIANDFIANAQVVAKQDGILAGAEETSYFFNKRGISVKEHKKDGENIINGDVIMELRGKLKDILKAERTGLNLLQRMSGIASLTYSLLSKARNAKIASTRKKLLGLLDARAVFLGRGYTHRLGLFESILIKENHLESLKKEGVKNYTGVAIELAWKSRDMAVFVEIEVRNKIDAIIAAEKFRELNVDKAKPCIIMFDNMDPEQVGEAIREIRKKGLYDFSLFEASGGVNMGNLNDFDRAGVDVVSLGLLTHSPAALDISMRIS